MTYALGLYCVYWTIKECIPPPIWKFFFPIFWHNKNTYNYTNTLMNMSNTFCEMCVITAYRYFKQKKLEVFSTSQNKFTGPIRIVNDSLYPDYEVNEAESYLSYIDHLSVEFFQNNGISSISVILLTNRRKDGWTDNRSRI